MTDDDWDIDPNTQWVRIPISVFIAGLIFLWLIDEMIFDYHIAVCYGVFAFIFAYLFWGWLVKHDGWFVDSDKTNINDLNEEEAQHETA